MTFVVAHVAGTRVEAHADWQLTRPDDLRRPSFGRGTLKLLTVGPNLCVGFAGNVELALAAVADARSALAMGDEARGLARLEWGSRSAACEFILVRHEPAGVITVKQGRRDCVATGWIGEYSAFEAFQKSRLTYVAEGLDELSVVGSAFDHVVDKANIEGVGVVAISVRPDTGGLIYAPRISVVAGFSEQMVPNGVPTPVHWGSAADGGYSCSISGSDNEAAVGIYFHRGKFGYVSAPLRLGLEPRVIRGYTQSRFVDQARRELGVNIAPGIDFS